MDRAILVEPKIKIGEELVQLLDFSQFPMDAAFWLFMSEPERWRLIIASRLVDSKGPKAAYREIQSVMSQWSERAKLSLDEISVVSPKDSLIKALRKAEKAGPTLTGTRMSRSAIDGVYIEDAYIYRLA